MLWWVYGSLRRPCSGLSMQSGSDSKPQRNSKHCITYAEAVVAGLRPQLEKQDYYRASLGKTIYQLRRLCTAVQRMCDRPAASTAEAKLLTSFVRQACARNTCSQYQTTPSSVRAVRHVQGCVQRHGVSMMPTLTPIILDVHYGTQWQIAYGL